MIVTKESTKMKHPSFIIVLVVFMTFGVNDVSLWGQSGLVAHWDLAQNGDDKSGNGHLARNSMVWTVGWNYQWKPCQISGQTV